ncbi:hypothetical protein pb186bvf_020497 [Paramecium bursaria]
MRIGYCNEAVMVYFQDRYYQRKNSIKLNLNYFITDMKQLVIDQFKIFEHLQIMIDFIYQKLVNDVRQIIV